MHVFCRQLRVYRSQRLLAINLKIKLLNAIVDQIRVISKNRQYPQQKISSSLVLSSKGQCKYMLDLLWMGGKVFYTVEGRELFSMLSSSGFLKIQWSTYEIIRMCPPKTVQYFFSKVDKENKFCHQSAPNLPIKNYESQSFNKESLSFIIGEKQFTNINLTYFNELQAPKYYSQIFDKYYQTKIHSLPRSNDLKPNAKYFVQKVKEKTPPKLKPEPKPKPKPLPKIKQPQLIKQIKVRQLPIDFTPVVKVFQEGTQLESNEFLRKCVEFDINHSKVKKIIKSTNQLESIKKVLSDNYDLFQKIYYHLSSNNPNTSGIYSISETKFQKFIEEQKYQTKRVTKAKIRLKLVSCLSIGDNQNNTVGEIKNFNRPQFFQFLLRIAMEKWCQIIPKVNQNESQEQRKKRQKYPLKVNVAFQKILKTLRKIQQRANNSKWRDENLTNYEASLVLKSYSFIFQQIYQKFAGITQKNMNTKTKKKMLLDEFKMIFIQAEIRKTKQALNDLQICFACSKKLQSEDGITEFGLDHEQFLQTFCRFADGLYLKPIGSESNKIWELDVIPSDQIPLFLKLETLLKEIYLKNYDIRSRKNDLLFQHGLFAEEVNVLVQFWKEKYQSGDLFKKNFNTLKNKIKLNSLEPSEKQKIDLKFLIGLLKEKYQKIQQQNRIKIQEYNELKAKAALQVEIKVT